MLFHQDRGVLGGTINDVLSRGEDQRSGEVAACRQTHPSSLKVTPAVSTPAPGFRYLQGIFTDFILPKLGLFSNSFNLKIFGEDDILRKFIVNPKYSIHIRSEHYIWYTASVDNL